MNPNNADANVVASEVLAAMRRNDFAAAVARFDRTMQRGLSAEKLKEVWQSQTRSLGKPGEWTLVQRTESQGMDVCVMLLQFEAGALLAVISVRPETQEIGGLWFQPAPEELVAAVKDATAKEATTSAAFTTESVTVGAAPFALDGTLTLPQGKGPFPAVVLVHGSGPHDRDETVGPNKPFKDLAEGLAAHGVAVLRYNKRTFQYRTKLSNNISLDDEVVSDAIAAVRVVRSQSKVNPDRIFVVGHSLGAQLAPEIARRAGSVAGVVLLAPPGRAPWDVVLDQMRYLQLPAEEVAKAEAAVAELKAGRQSELLGVPHTYWKDLAARDGVHEAKGLGKPILILRGERDYQVTGDDVEIWRAGLRGVPHVDLVTIPAANHLFIKGTGKPTPEEYAQPGHVDNAVITKLAEFVMASSQG